MSETRVIPLGSPELRDPPEVTQGVMDNLHEFMKAANRGQPVTPLSPSFGGIENDCAAVAVCALCNALGRPDWYSRFMVDLGFLHRHLLQEQRRTAEAGKTKKKSKKEAGPG